MSKPKRKSISKKLRFEIFKRDGFRCTYCGATPTDSPLHLDHIEPVSKGGGNGPENLVTACSSCNLGKGARELGDKQPIRSAGEAEREQAEQIREYLALQRQIYAARREVIDAIGGHWRERLEFPFDGLDGRITKLLDEFSPAQLMEAIDVVAARLGPPMGHSKWQYEDRIKYFYGVLRRWREGGLST